MAIISRSELLRFTFNPFGVGAYQIPFPQVLPVAIISRSELLRFTFNPFGVGAYQIPFPQVLPVAIHIQPLRGWCVNKLSMLKDFCLPT